MSGHGAAVAVDACAKVNLYLHVVGRRADGYHLLDSLVVFADVGDTIEAAPAAGLTLEIDGPFAAGLAGEADNLVLRAARALTEAVGVPAQARLRLTKRLPVASGIGGGSADAAAALIALAKVWRLEIAPDRLAAIGFALGADVPMCLAGRTAFVGGIGEEIAPAPALPRFWLVLANPGVAVPTPAVYRAYATAGTRFSAAGRFAEPPADARALADLLNARGNDLTDAAVRLAPAIGEVLAALSALPEALVVRMSGSGATGFALFDSDGAAHAAAARLAGDRPGWWVRAAPVAADRASG
jgi:4-diphosphocytidyl-2-C-methyl-D-erythritol kinase